MPGNKQVALHFRTDRDFDKALDILWNLRKGNPELKFGSPPVENVLIIPKEYLHDFEKEKLGFEKQKVVFGMEGLTEDDINELRREHFWPKQ